LTIPYITNSRRWAALSTLVIRAWVACHFQRNETDGAAIETIATRTEIGATYFARSSG